MSDNEGQQWQVIRQLRKDLDALKAEADRRAKRQDWILFKFLPMTAAIVMALASVYTVLHG